MRRKRLFIAINLPGEVKDRVAGEIEKFRYDFTNDIRFSERENWHVTVAFLGDQDDMAIGPILDSMQRVCGGFSAFEGEFDSISYGPNSKNPRMIWLNGSAETSEKLAELKTGLEDNLAELGVDFSREFRKFHAHVTLARFRGGRGLPEINRGLKLSFPVASLDLMESRLGKSGAEYELLQKVELQ